jgi:hypothetical protein
MEDRFQNLALAGTKSFDAEALAGFVKDLSPRDCLPGGLPGLAGGALL